MYQFLRIFLVIDCKIWNDGLEIANLSGLEKRQQFLLHPSSPVIQLEMASYNDMSSLFSPSRMGYEAKIWNLYRIDWVYHSVIPRTNTIRPGPKWEEAHYSRLCGPIIFLAHTCHLLRSVVTEYGVLRSSTLALPLCCLRSIFCIFY